MVVTELKLRHVQRHIFGADLVERTDDTALEDAPEAFNRVGVDRADNILLCGMLHGLARVFSQSVIDKISSVANSETLSETVSRTNALAASRVIRLNARAITLPFRLTAPMIGLLPDAAPPVLP